MCVASAASSTRLAILGNARDCGLGIRSASSTVRSTTQRARQLSAFISAGSRLARVSTMQHAAMTNKG